VILAKPVGVGVNPGHLDLDLDLRRLDWKVKACAEQAITQPVFDVEQLERSRGASRPCIFRGI
jgi:5,10-methylenetetrahydrofolate reductase